MDPLEITIDNAVPPFEQHIEQVKAAVTVGVLKAGDALPSIRQLANDLQLNSKTVAKHADRLYAMGVAVKICVYRCIAVTVFTSPNLTLSLLHLWRWELFALSVFSVIAAPLSSVGVIPRQRGVVGSAGPPPPGTPDLSAWPGANAVARIMGSAHHCS